MFCDLVGSTSLAARLDAEDWRNLVSAYLDAASAAATAFGGHVLKKLGDGLMALFGYPRRRRTTPSARCARRSPSSARSRSSTRGTPRPARRSSPPASASIAGRSWSMRPAKCSATRRISRRAFRRLPSPGSVLVTANVQRQTAGLFVAEDKGAHELKGVAAPVKLYRIVRASGGGRRGGARALTPLVGREEELDLLRRRWERARSGEGQLALIVGEPGIGKSRLVEEFRAQLGETPHTWVEWPSSQLLQNTPLHPIAEWGRQRFGGRTLLPNSASPTSRTRSRLIGLDPAEYAPLIAPLRRHPAARRTAPPICRRRSCGAGNWRRSIAWFLAGARSQPVVLAFEDLHWADPTSLDLMQALAERGGQAPLLIIATARPEFRAPWSLRSHHSVISLSPLDRAQVARWSARSPRATRCRTRWSRASASAPAACRCSSRR